jgi:hypothetical protein
MFWTLGKHVAVNPENADLYGSNDKFIFRECFSTHEASQFVPETMQENRRPSFNYKAGKTP